MATRVRFSLTDDELACLLQWHRTRAVELIARPHATLAARRLAKLALRHHEARIALLRAASEHAADVGEG